MDEDVADLLFEDVVDVVFGEVRAAGGDVLRPLRVLLEFGVVCQVFFTRQALGQQRHFRLQAGRENSEAHDFNQADVLLLDMVVLRVRVVHTERTLVRRDVVPQREVQFELAVPFTGDRRDRVVRFAVRLGEDERVFVRVASPGLQDVVREVDDPLVVFPAQADDRQWPVDDARLDVFVTGDRELALIRRLRHGKLVAAALEVVVAQDRAADDGQVRVGPEEVVRELSDEVEEFAERRAVDLHGHVFTVQDDAVLVVVDIRRVLEAPVALVDGDGDDAVVLPRRVVHPSGIALVLEAQLALRVRALLRGLGSRDISRVLLRFREVDRDVDIAELARHAPADVLRHARGTDVVRVLTEPVKPVRRLLGRFTVQASERPDDLRRPRRDHAHEGRVKEVASGDALALQKALFRGIVDEGVEDVVKALEGYIAHGFIVVEAQFLQKGVDQVMAVGLFGQAV